MYQLGQGAEKDTEEAVRWYRKAAKLGDAKAMFNLGASYYNGEGVPENPVSAYAWFLLAKDAGNAAADDAVHRSDSELSPTGLTVDAFLQVAEMYEKGEDLPQNYIEAARWYRKEADQSPRAALGLATLLINGTGVQQNYSEAMNLCQAAAKKNHSGAQYCLGHLYQRGLGVTADPKEAAKWYTIAAPANSKAALALSEMYLKGEGVAVDRPSAFYFLWLAYKRGSADAKTHAHTLRQEMSKDETKRLQKILHEHHLDPAKVFAMIDDPTPPEVRPALPVVQ